MVTKASGVLFEATKRRAYFKDVHILIPDKWDTISPDAIIGWEIYEVIKNINFHIMLKCSRI